MDDTADIADGTGDVDQGVDPESDDESDDLPDMISEGYSDSESDSDSEDENEDEDTIAEEVEDTVVNALDEDSVGNAAEIAVPMASPEQRITRGRVIRKPNNFVPTMTGKSHGESRDEGVNFPLIGKYQYAMRTIEDRENIKSQ